MSDHQHQRLEAAIKRRDTAQRNIQRLQGRLSAAQEDLAAVEQECQDKGIAPDKLDAAITQLERRFEAALSAFEKEVQETEGRLLPFQEERS